MLTYPGCIHVIDVQTISHVHSVIRDQVPGKRSVCADRLLRQGLDQVPRHGEDADGAACREMNEVDPAFAASGGIKGSALPIVRCDVWVRHNTDFLQISRRLRGIYTCRLGRILEIVSLQIWSQRLKDVAITVLRR